MSEAKEAKKAVSTKSDPLLDPTNRLKFDYFSFENVGDYIKGLYVGKYTSVSAKYGYTQENYVLLTEDGDKMVVSGRNARKSDGVRVIYGTEKIPLGAKMAFIFDREKPTDKGNPAKIIEIGYAGDKDMEALADFQDKYNLDDFAKEEETSSVATEDVESPEVPEM